MNNWEHTIVHWVNCLLDNSADYIQSVGDLNNASIYYKLINKIKSWNYNEYKGDSKRAIVLQFLKNEYPNVVFDFKSNEVEEFSIAILILSRLSLETVFHKSLCTRLQFEMQVKVKSILESVYTVGKKITLEDLCNIFSYSDSTNVIDTPRHVLKEFLNSPAPQTLSKDNKIHDQAKKLRHLRADIETLRYEKSELIEDLKMQEKKINELQAKLQDSIKEVKMLKEESLRSSSSMSSGISLNSSNEIYEIKSAESSYEKELHSLEKYISQLQNENCELLGEKADLEIDNKTYKSKCLLLEEKNKNNEHIIESVLQQIERKEDELAELRYRHEELRNYLKEKSKLSDEQSFECEEVSRILETSFNKSEVLSSVIDIQLQDTKKELESLQSKYNLLNLSSTAVTQEYNTFKAKFDEMTKEYLEMKYLYDKKCCVRSEERFTQTIFEHLDHSTQTITESLESCTQTEVESQENATQTEIKIQERCTQTINVENQEEFTQTINPEILEVSSQTDCIENRDIHSQTTLLEHQEQETQTIVLSITQFTQTNVPVQEQHTQTNVENCEGHTQTDFTGDEKHTQTELKIHEQDCQTDILHSTEQQTQTESARNLEQCVQTDSTTIGNEEKYVQTNIATQEQINQTEDLMTVCQESQTDSIMLEDLSMQTSLIENQEQFIQTDSIRVEDFDMQTSIIENQEQFIQTDSIQFGDFNTQTSFIENQEQFIQTDSIHFGDFNTQTSFIENQEQFIQTDSVQLGDFNTQTSFIENEEKIIQIENENQETQTDFQSMAREEYCSSVRDAKLNNKLLTYDNQEQRTKKLLQLFEVLMKAMDLSLTDNLYMYNYGNSLSTYEDAFMTLSKGNDTDVVQIVFDSILENKNKILEKIESITLPIDKKNDIKSTCISIFESLFQSLQMLKALLFWFNYLTIVSEKIKSTEEKYKAQSSEIENNLKGIYRENDRILSTKLIAATKFAHLLSKELIKKLDVSNNFDTMLLALPDFNANCSGWKNESTSMQKNIKKLGAEILELEKLWESENKIPKEIQMKEEAIIVGGIKETIQSEKTSEKESEKELKQRSLSDELLAKQKQQFDDYVAEIHEKYESKLEKMKEKMKFVYNNQITALKKEQESSIANKMQAFEAKLEKQCLAHSEELKKYKKHIKELTTQLWDVGEKLIIEKQIKEDFMSKLKEMKVKYDNIELASKRAKQDDNFKHPLSVQETKPNVLSSIENISSSNKIHFVRDFQMMGNAFKTEDEEGEVFDPIYLADMQNGQSIFPQTDVERLSVLQMRNSKCRPHLKSSYPTEMLNPVCLTEDDIKAGPSVEEVFNDSLSQSLLTGKKVKRKDRTRNGSETPRQSRRFSNIFRKGRLSTGGK